MDDNIDCHCHRCGALATCFYMITYVNCNMPVYVALCDKCDSTESPRMDAWNHASRNEYIAFEVMKQ